MPFYVDGAIHFIVSVIFKKDTEEDDKTMFKGVGVSIKDIGVFWTLSKQLIMTSSAVDKTFEIYTFYENRTEICIFFENRTEIYILSMADEVTIRQKTAK